MEASDLEELYKMVILDHARKPRNFGKLADASATVSGDNPSCGDQITVQICLENEKLPAVQFTGEGCSICMASASMMTQKVKQKSQRDAEALYNQFHKMITTTDDAEAEALSEGLGELGLLRGVRKFPQRVKCATLAWQALKEALAISSEPSNPQTVTTELEE